MKKGISQRILSIFLASMLLFGAITIATSSNGNTMILTMQTAEADFPPVNIAATTDECDEFGDGDRGRGGVRGGYCRTMGQREEIL